MRKPRGRSAAACGGICAAACRTGLAAGAASSEEVHCLGTRAEASSSSKPAACKPATAGRLPRLGAAPLPAEEAAIAEARAGGCIGAGDPVVIEAFAPAVVSASGEGPLSGIAAAAVPSLGRLRTPAAASLPAGDFAGSGDRTLVAGNRSVNCSPAVAGFSGAAASSGGGESSGGDGPAAEDSARWALTAGAGSAIGGWLRPLGAVSLSANHWPETAGQDIDSESLIGNSAGLFSAAAVSGARDVPGRDRSPLAAGDFTGSGSRALDEVCAGTVVAGPLDGGWDAGEDCARRLSGEGSGGSATAAGDTATASGAPAGRSGCPAGGSTAGVAAVSVAGAAGSAMADLGSGQTCARACPHV